jgi:osmotically-inducible protein OsmY
MACRFAPGCVETKTAAHRVVNAPRDGFEVAAQRASDQALTREVRGAIDDDPGLASAARAVAVTSDHGIVRLVGWVRTDKEKSSIAFKAAQMARMGGVDDGVTVGTCVAGALH